jgi:hypothetical protein
VTFATHLLEGPYLVLVNGEELTPVVTSNSTHTSLYCTYTHSSHTIEIVGTTVIPEFPTQLAVSLLLLTLTVTALFLKKRTTFNTESVRHR